MGLLNVVFLLIILNSFSWLFVCRGSRLAHCFGLRVWVGFITDLYGSGSKIIWFAGLDYAWHEIIFGFRLGKNTRPAHGTIVSPSILVSPKPSMVLLKPIFNRVSIDKSVITNDVRFYCSEHISVCHSPAKSMFFVR